MGRAKVAATADEPFAGRNEVVLSGRLSRAPVERELPSGDRVVSLRVVVRRPMPGAPRGRAAGQGGAGGQGRPRAMVDVIDVGCWAAGVRRAASRLREGDRVEVTGALRRRFFRGGAGVESRYEVEAGVVRRAP